MEIVDYLRIAKRRLAVLIGVPVLAALITVGLIVIAPTTYSATSTVAAPALVGGAAPNQYNGSQAVSQYVAAFQATAQGPVVRQAVAGETGVKASEIFAGLQVAQVGASAVMTLTFNDTNKTHVEPVLTSITSKTLEAMFGPQVTLARIQVNTATAAVKDANDAIAAWEKKVGKVDPQALYQAKLDRINKLQETQTSLSVNGSAAGAASLGGTLATARAELEAFGPILAEYKSLTTTRDAAAATLTSAQQGLASARAQQGAADPTKVAFISSPRPVDDGSVILTKVLPVTGAAVFLALALVVLLELLSGTRSRRRVGQHEATSSSQPASTQREPELVTAGVTGPATTEQPAVNGSEAGHLLKSRVPVAGQ